MIAAIAAVITILVIVAIGIFAPIIGIIVFVLLCIGIGIYAFVKPDSFRHIIGEIQGTPQISDAHNSEATTDSHVQNVAVTVPENESPQPLERIHHRLDELFNQQVSTSNNLGQKIIDLNDAVSVLQQQCQTIQQEITQLHSSLPQNKPTIVEETSFAYPAVYYAQTVDSQNPVGFTKEALSKNKDKCFFIIIQTSETEATYSLIAEKEIQDAVVSMFNPLITASSEYDSIPPQLTCVYTSQVGELELNNGIWKIINKQKVKIE